MSQNTASAEAKLSEARDDLEARLAAEAEVEVGEPSAGDYDLTRQWFRRARLARD